MPALGLGRVNLGPAIVFRAMKSKGDRVQAQPLDSQCFSKKPIVAIVAVGTIADDGMSELVEMAPELVEAPGSRAEFKPGISTGVGFVGLQRQLQAVEASELGHGLGEFPGRIRGQWAINHTFGFGPAAHHGLVGFSSAPLLKLPAQVRGRLGCQCHQKHTRGRRVQAMNGINVASKLIAQTVEDDALPRHLESFVLGRMNMVSRELVEREPVLALRQNLQHPGILP